MSHWLRGFCGIGPVPYNRAFHLWLSGSTARGCLLMATGVGCVLAIARYA